MTTTPLRPVLRAVLACLPREFRDEFAGEIMAVFEARFDAARGVRARAAVWLVTAGSVLRLALGLHLERWSTDLRDGRRALANRPGLSATIAGLLAVAFGPITVVMGLARAVVVDPLPVPGADRVVAVGVTNERQGLEGLPMSAADFLDYATITDAVGSMAAWYRTSVALGAPEGPRRTTALVVAGDLGGVLDTAPRLGRGFSAADQMPGAPAVVIFSDAFWRGAFGARPSIVGDALEIDGRSRIVIGVLPPALPFPREPTEIWLPAALDPLTANRGMHYLEVAGRLAPGVSIDVAESRLRAQAAVLAGAHPLTNAGESVRLSPLGRAFSFGMTPIVTVLGAAALALWLLAVTNVAGLLAVRTTLRQRDAAIRASLGAAPARLRRAELTEHLLVTLAAAAMGFGAAWLLLEALSRTSVFTPSVLERAGLDGGAVIILVAAALVTAKVLALLAGARGPRGNGGDHLRGSGRGEFASMPSHRWRQTLVAIQVAATLALVATAGLLLQSAARLARVDPGFRADGVLSFIVSLPPPRFDAHDQRMRAVDAIAEQLSAQPGVEGLGVAGLVPMGGDVSRSRFVLAGRPAPAPGAEPSALIVPASPGYRQTLGIPLLAGRWIEESDREGAPLVTVIDASFARRHFRGENPIGQRLRLITSRPEIETPLLEIVGVVADIRQIGVSHEPEPLFYRPLRQWGMGQAAFFVRTKAAPALMAGAVHRAVASGAPGRPVEGLAPLADLVSSSTEAQRALVWLLAAAALIALAVSMTGLYGVTAAAVSARRRELAIRAALGAAPSALAVLVIRGVAVAVGGGLVAGVAGAASMARVAEAQLYETAPLDPVTFLLVPPVLAVAALAAVAGPLRRVSRIAVATELNRE